MSHIQLHSQISDFQGEIFLVFGETLNGVRRANYAEGWGTLGVGDKLRVLYNCLLSM